MSVDDRPLPITLVGTTLELLWRDGAREERNTFHVVAAPPAWFCGPGAFVVRAAGVRRLGSEA